MMPFRRSAAIVCVGAATVLSAAACGSDDSPSSPSSSSSTTQSDAAKVPAPIGELGPFLAAIDNAGGCSDALVAGIDDTVGALNVWGTNHAGTAKVTGHTWSRIAGVPACTFTIDRGNTDIPTTVIVAGLPSDQNTVLSKMPASTFDPDGGYDTGTKVCSWLGTDKVAAAAAEIVKSNGSPKLVCGTENSSAASIISVDTQPLAITGRAGADSADDGWFVAVVDSSAARNGLTSDMSGVVANWFDRESQPGSERDYSTVGG